MNPQQNSSVAGPAILRTGGIVPISGTWRVRCSRAGCYAVEKMNLQQGRPAPCCVRCLNPARLTFLHAAAPTGLPAAPPAEAPNQTAAPTSSRTGEIVSRSGTWSIRCLRDGCCHVEEKMQHKGAWADPCSRCHSPAVLIFLCAAWPPRPSLPSGTRIESGIEISRSGPEAPVGELQFISKEDDPPSSGEAKQSIFDRLKMTGKPAKASKAGK
jgi:hypothetical protein